MLNPDQKSGSGPTRTTEVLEILRSEILAITRHPGERLRFDELRNAYDVGISPLREALMHLASEGLVVAEERRGYRVAPVSKSDLREVAHLRGKFDSMAIQASIEHGDEHWEGRVVAAFHALLKRPKVQPDGTADARWEENHIRFHSELVSACNLRKLLSFRHILELQAKRYRRMSVLYASVARDDVGEHTAIRNAVLDRDENLASELIQEHYRITVEALLTGIDGDRFDGFSSD